MALRLAGGATARQVLLELAQRCHYLLPSAAEGELLFGTADPAALAQRAFALGVQAMVVKLGDRGAAGYTGDGQTVHVPAFPVRVVDTVGAGDGWAAGFTVATLRGYPFAEAIRLANAVGALVCTVAGDVEGLPLWDEVQAFLGAAPPPVER